MATASSAVALCTSNSYAADLPAQSPTAQRAADARAGALSAARGIGMPVLPRTSLVGKVAVGPVVVRGVVGQTVVANSLVVNPGTIVSGGPGATAAVLEARCPLIGGRIVIRGNRIINNGRVMSFGDNATAAVVLERCSGLAQLTGRTDIFTGNLISNGGRVTAGR